MRINLSNVVKSPKYLRVFCKHSLPFLHFLRSPLMRNIENLARVFSLVERCRPGWESPVHFPALLLSYSIARLHQQLRNARFERIYIKTLLDLGLTALLNVILYFIK